MTIPFYPQHENACPHVGCCPHLGGTSIATVVNIANHSQQSQADRLRDIRVLEAENSRLLNQVVQLQDQLVQAKLELKLERQNKFAPNKQQQSESPPIAKAADLDKPEAKKRGAPKGHPGWFRPTPRE